MIHSRSILKALLATCFLFAFLVSNAQSGKQARYMTKVIDDLRVREFIPNNGQYQNLEDAPGEVKFAVENALGEYVLFTKNSLEITFPVHYIKEDEEDVVTPVKGENREQFGRKFETTAFTWQNTSPDVELVVAGPANYTHYYRNPGNVKSFAAQGYSELTYKNLYPGIDVQFVFHEVKGLKYQYIVHPGADISQIRWDISGHGQFSMRNGRIEIRTERGLISDAAPMAYYSDSRMPLSTSYKAEGNTISFDIEQHDSSREVIIDPWLISPGFDNNNSAYDCCTNPTNGDIFVYGGTADYQVKRYDVNGTLIWSYVTTLIGIDGSNYYGDMVVDDDGFVYIANGCCSQSIIKINGETTDFIWETSGFSEPWRLDYDEVTERLVAAGYFGIDYIATIDPENGGTINTATLVGTGVLEEIRSLGFTDDNDIMCLHVSAWLAADANTNYLSRCNSDLVTQFWTQSGYTLEEGGSFYADSESGGFCVDPDCFHGFNGIANTGDLIFTYNGSELIKRTIADGTELLSATIPGGIIDTNSGVLADSCGYIYVGTQTEIRQYDYDLQFVAAVPVTGAVYDLFLNSNNDIVACGDGWVMTMLSGCSGFHVQTQITPPLCTGDCNASIIAEGAGGVEPYSYIWNPGNIVNPEIADICSGIYTVTAIDADGDTVYAEVQVNDPQLLEVDLNIVESACGANNGSVTAVATGGTPTYDYSWSPGAATTAAISDLTPGNYTLTLTDENGCEVVQSADVPQGPPPSVEFNINEPQCFEDCNGSLTANVNDGTAPYDYIWSNTLTTQSINSLCPGTYTVQITDAYGCTGNESVDLPSAPAINIVVDVDQCKDDGADGTLTVTATGGHPGFEYTWLVIPVVNGQILDSIPAGSYPLLIEDANNCIDTFDVVLPPCPHDSLFIPNIFTPNNDSDNDMFQIYNTGFRTLNCQIYNRWGNVVYEWNKTAGFWDGEIDGRPAEDGVYYYVLEGERYSGEMVKRAGYFHLVAQKEE